MDNICLEISKNTITGIEKAVLYSNGNYIKTINEKLEKEGTISFVDELMTELINKASDLLALYPNKDITNIMPLFTVKINYNGFEAEYKDCFDLYLDINLILRNGEMRKLSVEKILKDKEDQKNKEELEKEYQQWIEETQIQFPYMSSRIDKDYNKDFDKQSYSILKMDLEEMLSKKTNVGDSRVFGEIIDIPELFEIPKHYKFFAQINLAECTKYDVNDLLPKKGYLYFFNNDEANACKVMYVEDTIIKRVDVESNWDSDYCLKIVSFKKDIEKTASRYENNEWDGFAGEELSKIYGIYTDCQMNENNIKEITNDYIILLQIGSLDFNEICLEGVTTYLIKKEDLINRNFDKVIYNYSQT